MGHAIKAGGTVFNPTQPADVENDPEGQDEFPEPNPDKETEVNEEDTDKEDNEEKEPDDDI